MRIKTDFVTNSSSSSFIVAFDKRIEKIEDLHMISGEHKYQHALLKDCLSQEPLELIDGNFDYDFDPAIGRITKTLADIIRGGYLSELSAIWSEVSEIMRKTKRDYFAVADEFAKKKGYENIQDYENTICKKYAVRFIEENKGKFIYIFHYSDETEFGSEMEHGGLFLALPHIHVDQH